MTRVTCQALPRAPRGDRGPQALACPSQGPRGQGAHSQVTPRGPPPGSWAGMERQVRRLGLLRSAPAPLPSPRPSGWSGGCARAPLQAGLLPGHVEFTLGHAPETVPARGARQTRGPGGKPRQRPFSTVFRTPVFPEFAGPQSVIHVWCEQRRRFAEERKRAGGSAWLLVASAASGSALLERGTLREIGLQTALRRPGTAMQRREWPPPAIRLRWPR